MWYRIIKLKTAETGNNIQKEIYFEMPETERSAIMRKIRHQFS